MGDVYADVVALCRKFVYGEESHICIVILILYYCTILLMLVIIHPQGAIPIFCAPKWALA